MTTLNVSSTAHGFAPKSPADATKFLNGAATPTWAQVKGSDLSMSDVTTNNVSTSAHGFAPKLPNDATKYLDGTGAYSVPAGFGGGAWTLLSTTTLSVDGTFDVSSISQAYSDLQLTVIARGTDAGTNDALRLRFNNDTASNYYYTTLSGNGSAASANETAGAVSLLTPNAQIPSAGATASMFGITRIWVPGYASTTWLKAMRSEAADYYGTASTNHYVAAISGLWNSTGAINRVQLFGASTANLKAGSVLRIYGIS